MIGPPAVHGHWASGSLVPPLSNVSFVYRSCRGYGSHARARSDTRPTGLSRLREEKRRELTLQSWGDELEFWGRRRVYGNCLLEAWRSVPDGLHDGKGPVIIIVHYNCPRSDFEPATKVGRRSAIVFPLWQCGLPGRTAIGFLGDRTTLREKLGEGGIGSLCGVELLGYAWKVAHLCDQPTPAYSRPSIRPLSQTYLSYLYARVHGHPLLRQSRWIPGVRCSLCRVRDLQRSSLLIKSAIARTSITTTPSPSGF